MSRPFAIGAWPDRDALTRSARTTPRRGLGGAATVRADRGRRSALAALVVALMWLVLGAAQAQAQPDDRGHAPMAWSNLGAGPASTTLRDPVQILALDIAEHLPAQLGGAAMAPLPLHAPWPPLDAQMLDELQGVEWGGLWPPAGAGLPAVRRHPLPVGTRFDSIDPRHHDRPPSAADRLRP